MPEQEARFNCANCGAQYKGVRVEAPTAADREIVCLSCGVPLEAREGRFALNIFSWGALQRVIVRDKAPLHSSRLYRVDVARTANYSLQILEGWRQTAGGFQNAEESTEIDFSRASCR